MARFRVKMDEAEYEVNSDGAVERCTKCGAILHLKTEDESRRKCRDCINEVIGAKEMYHER